MFVLPQMGQKKFVKGWYFVGANSTEKIYKTERASDSVGIHVFAQYVVEIGEQATRKDIYQLIEEILK